MLTPKINAFFFFFAFFLKRISLNKIINNRKINFKALKFRLELFLTVFHWEYILHGEKKKISQISPSSSFFFCIMVLSIAI